jgi:hypothetical protein
MGGLAFLSPLYLLGALAIALPIALHLFRRRTETVVDFPAVRLLAHSPVEQQRRRRLREIILLALRVSALVLLAGSFARPYLAGSVLAGNTPVTVVALDTSFSMAAPAVFDRARAAAVAAIDAAPSGHAVALITFDDGPTTVVAPTTDRSAAAAAVATLRPGVLPTRYGAALGRAAEVIGGRPGRLVVVTDAQQSGWEGSVRGGLGDDIEVVVSAIEGARHNLAVTTAERRGGAGRPVRVEATVRNYGLEQREVPVTLEVDGREVARTTVTAGPQSTVPVRFDAEVPASGGATVTIADPEGMPADDRRYLLLDPAVASRVTVVVADPGARGGGLYVERALGVAEDARAFTVTVADGRTFSSWPAERLAREQALIVLGTRTLERQGRAGIARFVATGGSLLLTLGPDTDPGTLGDVLGTPPRVGPDAVSFADAGATLVVGDARHPIFRRFAAPAAALGDVTFSRHRPIDESGRVVLARFSGGAPALVEEADAKRPRAAVRLGSGQPVEPIPVESRVRAVRHRDRAIPDGGRTDAAVVGLALGPARGGRGARTGGGRAGRWSRGRNQCRYRRVEPVADERRGLRRGGAAGGADAVG